MMQIKKQKVTFIQLQRYLLFPCLDLRTQQKISTRYVTEITFHEEMMASVSSKTQKKVIKKILAFINESSEKPQKSGKQKSNLSSFSQAGGKNATKQKSKNDSLSCLLEPRIQTSLNSNLRKFDISIPLQKNVLNLKTSLIWSPYHSTNENLNFTSMTKNLVKGLHTGYIDNMPQGPWIRRNEFGVLFTDNILDEGNESSFITTARNEEAGRQSPEEKDYEDDEIDEEDYNFSGSLRRFETENSEKIEHKKKAQLKQMKLDLKIENKLNKIIKKKDDNTNSDDKI